MEGTALVLGGGGLTGVAWEWGMLTGLAEAGVDLTTADLVVGTSAGSVVGAQVASGIAPRTGFERQLAGAGAEVAASMGRLTGARYVWSIVSSRDAQVMGRRLGRLALAADTVPEHERFEIIESRLPVRQWPERPLLITAVDAESGEFTVFDRLGDASLPQAVAASCAVPGVWPPVTIAGRRYIDGGARSGTNADLARDYARIVILAPITAGFGASRSAERHADALGRGGAEVIVVSPDQNARRAFGRNVLDPARRAPAARAGLAQAATAAEAVGKVWS